MFNLLYLSSDIFDDTNEEEEEEEEEDIEVSKNNEEFKNNNEKNKKFKDLKDKEDDEELIQKYLEKEEELEKKENIIEEEKKEDINKNIVLPKNNQKYYNPKDFIENWMIENNNKDKALEKTTHISQLGGYYCIELREDFLQNWMLSIQCEENFFIQEIKTEYFKLNLNFNFKLKNKDEEIDLLKIGLIKHVQDFSKEYFDNQINSLVLISKNFEKNNENSFKNEFILYFPFIYIDDNIYESYCNDLLKYLKKHIDNIEKDGIFVPKENYLKKKIKIYGSVKANLNQDFQNSHKLIYIFDNDNKLLKDLLNFFNENIFELVQLTSIQYYDQNLIKNFKNNTILKAKLFIKNLTLNKIFNKELQINVTHPTWFENDFDYSSNFNKYFK
jgi:hypothetical protein